jgi:hypothetical protein
MKPHPTDAMARLSAADPARDMPISENDRAALWQLLATTPAGAPTSVRRRPRLLRLTVVIPALLVLSAGALAAGGVIRIGAPAEPIKGFSTSPRGGGVVAGTDRLLKITAPDPGGGPPWGMRVLSTKAGEGCVQVGRLLDGKLGAVGQDSAFHDDSLFHAFAFDSAFAKSACTLLDGNERIFLNATVGDMPASAWVGYGGGCVPSTATHAERFNAHGKPLALCPQADERNLYYGLLGPDAESITYKLDGHTHTQATVGPEGAYLLITTASPTQLFNFNAGGTQDVVPVDGPITELHYRDDSTCHLTARSWIGGKDACTPTLREPVGWAPPRAPTPTAAQVATPLRALLLRNRHGGYEIALSFRSRIAIDNARLTYKTMWREPGMPAGIYSGGPLTPSSPAAGQTESAQVGGGRRGLPPGVTSGEVLFMDATGPGNLEEGPGTVEHVVGRFSVRVP